LTAAALVLALHAGLLLLMAVLRPPTQQAIAPADVAMPSTVVVLLEPLLLKPTPPHNQIRQPKTPPTNAAAPLVPASSATGTWAPSLPNTSTATAVTQPTSTATAEDKSTPTAPLNVGTPSLQSAVREADRNSVRRLALQSGKMDELETATPHPIALVAAEASVPRCPPAGQLRESGGPQGYALTRDRSGDCETERKAKVRALALGR
jgi:hypothetical protein